MSNRKLKILQSGAGIARASTSIPVGLHPQMALAAGMGPRRGVPTWQAPDVMPSLGGIAVEELGGWFDDVKAAIPKKTIIGKLIGGDVVGAAAGASKFGKDLAKGIKGGPEQQVPPSGGFTFFDNGTGTGAAGGGSTGTIMLVGGALLAGLVAWKLLR